MRLIGKYRVFVTIQCGRQRETSARTRTSDTEGSVTGNWRDRLFHAGRRLIRRLPISSTAGALSVLFVMIRHSCPRAAARDANSLVYRSMPPRWGK
jgi:hypothetical protein